jgi:hypothetical protein
LNQSISGKLTFIRSSAIVPPLLAWLKVTQTHSKTHALAELGRDTSNPAGMRYDLG